MYARLRILNMSNAYLRGKNTYFLCKKQWEYFIIPQPSALRITLWVGSTKNRHMDFSGEKYPSLPEVLSIGDF